MNRLADFRRIVVKIGSALLVDSESGLRDDWLYSLCFDVAELRKSGCDVCIVSSGAIALGRIVLANLARENSSGNGQMELEEAQASAAVGQIELAKAYASKLATHNQLASQILLTLDDTTERRRYLNARNTLEKLMQWDCVPVINENDTVATAEIRYGDNDRLAARVASMIGADLLVLLSDVDGLYKTWPPESDEAKPIERIDKITPEIESMAGEAGSELSRGGMKTKIAAAKIATTAGASMVVTSGKHRHPLKRLAEGASATWFAPNESPVSDRKKWIAGQLAINGTITVDEGACDALKAGNSLLPAGATRVNGVFVRGDTVCVVNESGFEIARGLVAYDSNDAVAVAGKKSREIAELMGAGYRTELIHRDDLVMNSPGGEE